MRFALPLVALAAELVSAHYTFPSLIVGGTVTGQWQYVRMTDNHYSNGPVTDVTSPLMKCYETTTASTTSTYVSVAAGSTIGFGSNTISHPGYLSIYMAAANPASDESAGSGNVWFKIYDMPPTFNPSSGFSWPSQGLSTVTFPIPSQVPPGQYLVRIEHIALHTAGSVGGAQFYIACAQVQVTGGGSGSPSPLVAFPGAYTATDPGIKFDIYANYPDGTVYYPPGPTVWPGGGSGGGGGAQTTTTTPRPTATTSVKTTTASTTKVATTTTTTTTTTASGPTQTHYGQCGGQGYTGPTTCASPYTCKASSAYYSQVRERH